jgi:type II secretory pathway pseudopilin PulG
MVRAFTLVELLAVIAVIIALAAILVPVTGIIQREAARTRTRSLLAGIEKGIIAYQQDHGRLPASAEYTLGTAVAAAATNAAMLHRELVSTSADGRGRPRPGYLAETLHPADVGAGDDGPLLVDRWGSPVIYIAPTAAGAWPAPAAFGAWSPYPGRANACELWSRGPDGTFADLRGDSGGDPDADNIPAATYDPGASAQR